MARSGNPGAFETIVDRYQGRLLGFCRQMLGSTEDAEDVLQEVFVNAYRAMLADEREINLRPWLYRIARNRCLNHLRKPTADAQESMDMVPAVEASSTAERVHNREEFRQLLSDVSKLPETQRSALLLREMDALSYEEIAAAMETTRALGQVAAGAGADLARRGEPGAPADLRRGPARALRSRRGPAQGLRPGPPPRPRVRRMRRLPLPGPLQREGAGGALPGRAADRPQGLHRLQARPRRAGAGGGRRERSAGAAGAAGAGAVGSVGAAISGSGAASGIGAIGGAIGTKAVAGVVTAAVITAGAVEVKQNEAPSAADHKTPVTRVSTPNAPAIAQAHVLTPPAPTSQPPSVTPPPPAPPQAPAEPAPVTTGTAGNESAGQSTSAVALDPTVPATGITDAAPSTPGAHGTDGTVVVTVGGGTTTSPPPSETTTPPAESTPPPPPSESGTAPSESSTAPPESSTAPSESSTPPASGE